MGNGLRLLHPALGARISQRFGENPHMYAAFGLAGHEGVDFAVAVGTPISAAHDGVVRSAQGPTYGIQAWLEGDGVTTLYAHLSGVLRHGAVRAGDVIALSGNTGRSTGAHLHMGLKIRGWFNPAYKDWLDPLPLLEEQGGRGMLTTAHIQRTEPWMSDWLRDLGPRWYKQVNPSPGQRPFADKTSARFNARIWTDDIDGQYISRGRQGGRDFVRHMEPRWRAIQGVSAYSLANEPACNSNEELAQLREYTLGAIEEAVRLGLPLCVLDIAEANPGDNGTNNPEVSAWKLRQLTPAVKAASDAGFITGLHGYWHPAVEPSTGRWHAMGRIVWTINTWLDDGVDPGKLKVLVSEFGIDGLINRLNPYRGWRTLSNDQDYTRGVVEAEQMARGCPPIQGICYFTFGFEGEWGDYNHHEPIARQWIAPLKALGPIGSQPATPPAQPGDPYAGHLDMLRRHLDDVPITAKAALERGYQFLSERPVPGRTLEYFATCYSPGKKKYVTLVVAHSGGRWQVVREMDVSAAQT